MAKWWKMPKRLNCSVRLPGLHARPSGRRTGAGCHAGPAAARQVPADWQRRRTGSTTEYRTHDRPPILQVRNLVTRFDIRSGLFDRVKSRVHAVENVSLISTQVKRWRWWGVRMRKIHHRTLPAKAGCQPGRQYHL
ncbi:hypothetical protein WDV93_12655 [Pantoea ananatis]